MDKILKLAVVAVAEMLFAIETSCVAGALPACNHSFPEKG